MRPVVIYGAGPFAALLKYFLTQDARREVVACTVDREHLSTPDFCGLPVVPFEALADRYPPDAYDLLIAIGYKIMRARRTVFEKARAAGFRPINFISTAAVVYPNVVLGGNNIIFPGCIVEPGAVLGDNNVFWSGTVIGHDSRIGSHNFVGARTVLGGECRVGELCFLGLGSLVLDHLEIHDETHLLPGTVLYANTEPFTKYLGNPAKAFKRHEREGIIIER